MRDSPLEREEWQSMHQLRRMRELKSFTLRATDGDIGGIEELYFDDEAGPSGIVS